MVLLILAALWGAVLIPPALRARAEASPADSIGSFRRQLRILQRTAPGPVASVTAIHPPWPVSPARGKVAGRGTSRVSRARVQKRRRDIFFALLAGMAGSLLLGFLPALRVMWGLHVALDVAFLAYVGLLLHMRNVAAERDMKVRFLPGSTAELPPLLLRRTGN